MRLRTIGRATSLALGVAGGVAGLAALAVLRRPIPQTSGMHKLPGLSASVEVLRDRWGVPHIYAQTTTDLFRAQGYVHAQDRLWQMEFQRRLSHGRLSEILGSIALDTDRFVRILGFSRVAHAEVALLDQQSHALLQAYADGVNAYINQHRNRLPVEFTLLRIRPEPWQIADTLAWSKIMANNLCGNWNDELMRARVIATLGAERATQLDPSYPDGHPLIVPDGAKYTEKIGDDILRLANGAAPFLRNGAGQGSNNWVVAGTHTATRKPLLANDPHLAIAMPSIWYENHLCGGDYHVAGASFVGTPGVIIGHNERIAWGVTNGTNDVQDCYLERFDPTNPTRYRYKDEWETATIIHEAIQIKGQAEPHIETVRITRHGPVISPLIPNGESPASTDDAIALRWNALEPSGRLIKSVLRLNKAHDWTSFREALSDWQVPSQNFVYADLDGHIGYTLGGDIPIRARGDGRLPVPGWSGEYEWTGMVPHHAMPQQLDPPRGFAVTANNKVVGNTFPYSIPGEYLNGFRSQRIQDLLSQTSQHTSESFARIHRDVRSLPGLTLAALAGRLPADEPVARAAREALSGWDGDLTAESIGGAIYASLRDHLCRQSYQEFGTLLEYQLGLGAFASLPGEDILMRAFPGILRRLSARDDQWLPAGRTWDRVLAEAWQATLNELRTALGDDVATWRYGRLHTLTIRHPLGAVPGLDRLLNRGPFPTGGDVDTVCMGHLPRRFASTPYYVAPSYRQILDLADWNRSRSIHPTGQSGHPASSHYADFVQPWLAVDYHPMPWDRPHVEEATARRLTLNP